MSEVVHAFRHEAGASIAVAGARIYFELAGPDDAPPLLLLHGGLGTMEDFNPLLPHGLADAFRLIAIDSRGHGGSTLGDVSLTYERLEQDAVAVLHHLGITRTDVLGFSDGGIVGYRLMASAAVTIPRLATIGAGHALRPDDPVRDILANVTATSWLQRFPGDDALYRRVNPAPDFERLVRAVVGMWLDSSPAGYPGDAVDRLGGALLVMRGDDDPLFGRRAAVDLAERVPGAVMANIPFAGHAAHVDRPRMVGECITEFLRLGRSH